MTPGRAGVVTGFAAAGVTAAAALARHAWQTAGPPGFDFGTDFGADLELALWLVVAVPLTGLFCGFAGWVVVTERARAAVGRVSHRRDLPAPHKRAAPRQRGASDE